MVAAAIGGCWWLAVDWLPLVAVGCSLSSSHMQRDEKKKSDIPIGKKIKLAPRNLTPLISRK